MGKMSFCSQLGSHLCVFAVTTDVCKLMTAIPCQSGGSWFGQTG